MRPRDMWFQVCIKSTEVLWGPLRCWLEGKYTRLWQQPKRIVLGGNTVGIWSWGILGEQKDLSFCTLSQSHHEWLIILVSSLFLSTQYTENPAGCMDKDSISWESNETEYVTMSLWRRFSLWARLLYYPETEDQWVIYSEELEGVRASWVRQEVHSEYFWSAGIVLDQALESV